MGYGRGLDKTAWGMERLFTTEGRSACLWSSTLQPREQELVSSMAWFKVSIGMALGPVHEREELEVGNLLPTTDVDFLEPNQTEVLKTGLDQRCTLLTRV